MFAGEASCSASASVTAGVLQPEKVAAARGARVTARGLDELPAIGPAVVTLGVFDGVHLGHRHSRGRDGWPPRASATRASVALVFSPHPDEVVRPGTVVERLLPPEVTLERLSETGIDHALEIRFDDALRIARAGGLPRGAGTGAGAARRSR